MSLVWSQSAKNKSNIIVAGAYKKQMITNYLPATLLNTLPMKSNLRSCPLNCVIFEQSGELKLLINGQRSVASAGTES